MQEAKQFEVKWRLVNLTTFMYGTKLRFDNDDIYFENPLMPSGTVIHNWYMLTNFAEDRVSPKLPILKKGHRYLFKFNFQVEPEGAAYFKIKFYRKNKEQFEYKILKNKEEEIVYPIEAHSYQLELVNAGMNHLHFQNIMVQELGDGTYRTPRMNQTIDLKEKFEIMNRVINKARANDLDTPTELRGDRYE
ncbi:MULTISPECIES: accessory Sec system protein Asp3 [Staphylococcus]|uniref:accessory Sec system protein Asp3 n=1 Tax=Staphylococcus TaxID=1279 RepID=UPI000CCFDDFC|nr:MULTISPECIES: accessory Sec system protein Asp3 [Staphylococcus]MDI9230661.1 accessory Sec system protein Asp3 [Staphylococcus caprae]POA04481.1 accessory Sec system protein Asp3 [Staphylococcus caprae]SUL94431.1 accessory Sec system asp3 [Staphylococcus caprae]HCG75641.1 accessory Sec system protein Asp3 [Staphylococcus sp.]